MKGKFPTGSEMYVSLPIARSIYTTATVTAVEMTTQGFTITRVVPGLPVNAPSEGSIEIRIYIKTPTTAYNGPLDYVVRLDATN